MSFSGSFPGAALRLLFLIAAISAIWPGAGHAHFTENLVVRSFLAARDSEAGPGPVVYLRVPAPLVFGDLLQDIAALPGPDSGAILFADPARGGVILSGRAIADDPDAFEDRLRDHLRWRDPDGALVPRLLGWRMTAARPSDDYTTLEQARTALAGPSEGGDLNIATASIEFALAFDTAPDARLQVDSALPPLQLRPGLQLENHVVDLRQTPARIYSAPGQLTAPMSISPGIREIFGQFVHQGMIHVFGGLDHVLLIVAVTLGSMAFRPLVIGLTGFTIGHSITLIAGFLGITTPGSTFIVVVETAVAATVAFAAIQGLRGRPAHPLSLILVGLLHGFGFSFVLREILGPESPALLSSLFAFNIGIEVAQIVIVAGILALAWAVRRLPRGGRVFHHASTATLVGTLGIALYWCVERLGGLIA